MGAITKRKGIIELLDAIKIVEDSFQTININIFLIGTGPLDNYIDKFIIENNLKIRIIRKKKISERQKSKILKNSDIFILQSDHEGLPMAILEAMACGLLIITTPVGGIPDVVINKKNGLLISPHNTNELVDAMNWVIENPLQTQKIRLNNIKSSIHYSWEKIDEVYHKLLQLN